MGMSTSSVQNTNKRKCFLCHKWGLSHTPFAMVKEQKKRTFVRFGKWAGKRGRDGRFEPCRPLMLDDLRTGSR